MIALLKKRIFVKKLLMFICVVKSLQSHQDLNLTNLKKENVIITNDPRFGDKPFMYQQDEYEEIVDEFGNSMAAIDEYEQYVCDTVQPPVLSPIQIYIAEIFGYIYWHMIMLQHVTYAYASGMKQHLNQWVASLLQKYHQLSKGNKKSA